MPGQNYKSVSLKDELIERIKQLIQKIGTYHSVSEFVSEALRLRIETLEKNVKAEKEAETDAASTSRKGNRP